MGVRWARRAAGRRVAAGDDVAPSDVVTGPTRGGGGAPRVGAVEAETVIDLRERGGGWAARVEPDPQRAAELAQRFRARAARAEAQRDLLRLRARHWSGSRLIEEGRIDELEWWEHPEADPYAVLGLLPGARLEDAAAARRRIAQRCHPDRAAESGEDPEVAIRRMVAANAAYDRLRRALLTI